DSLGHSKNSFAGLVITTILRLVLVLYNDCTANKNTPRSEGCFQANLLDYQLLLPPPLKSRRGRSSRGRAWLTVMVRPPSSLPLRADSAALPSSSFSNSTQPKPLLRPVSRSLTTTADATVPCSANAAWSSSSVVAKGRPPTNNLYIVVLYIRNN